MNKNKPKIVLHCLPPALTVLPSPAFSILKAFLETHGIKAEVLYWNLYLDRFFSERFTDYFDFKGKFGERDLLYLLPFLSMISRKFPGPHGGISKERIFAYLGRVFPRYLGDPEQYAAFLSDFEDRFNNLFDSVMDEKRVNNAMIFGFSSKFYQWLPGMILAEKLKERFPEVKTVIGGFGSKEAAAACLQVCPAYDFAVWGEGEAPLLELSRFLIGESTSLENVPRLVFREQEALQLTNGHGDYLDFDEGILPDYKDFFDQVQENKREGEPYALPVEAGRGCHWNKCRFCFLNAGYKNRSRSPENIVKEIDTLFGMYHITNYYFVCNDVVGPDTVKFERLLDLLIGLIDTHQVSFDFFVEITHHGLHSRIIKKMALAGFRREQVGYEAITDPLLKKINKKTDFADTILFLKFAKKYGIEIIGANIMRGIAGEIEDDVFQSIKNLPFLRFILTGQDILFSHTLSALRLQANTVFFQMVEPGDKKKWNYNPITHLLPESFIDEEQRFNLFDFSKPLDFQAAWDWFADANRYYQETSFTYRILSCNGVHYYYESMNGETITHTIFDQPGYWEVLQIANHEVVSFDRMWEHIDGKIPSLNKEKMREIIGELKSSFLLYANDDLTRIVSIIDTDLAD